MLTYSKPMALGTIAPDFSLLDTVSDKILSLAEIKSPQATVIMFICNHCPFVQHIISEVAELAKSYQAKGVSFVAISANDIVSHPQDGPTYMQQIAQTYQFAFPYLYDASQQVAKNYGAACTPEFFIFDGELKCAYHGRFDDSSPGKALPVTGRDLSAALDATLQNKPAPQPQYPSMGCNIKWKM